MSFEVATTLSMSVYLHAGMMQENSPEEVLERVLLEVLLGKVLQVS